MATATEGQGDSHGDSRADLDERYDRQIRLWGADAQKSISRSRALICGLSGVNAEVCKNLVLAGISVTIQDSACVTAADLGAQFFLSPEDIGKNRAAAALSRVRELNAFVTVKSIEASLGAVSDEDIAEHNVVVAAAGMPVEQARLNKTCRQNRIAFFAASSFGEDGCFIVDLGEEHVFRRETGTGERAVLSDPMTVRFPSLEEIEAVLWSTLTERRAGPVPPVFVMGQRMLMTYRGCISRPDDLPAPPLFSRAPCPPWACPGHRNAVLRVFERRFGALPDPANEGEAESLVQLASDEFARNGLPADFLSADAIRHLARVSRAEFSPVSAVLGGVISQEVIKAVSGKGEPISNVFLYEGACRTGTTIRVPRV